MIIFSFVFASKVERYFPFENNSHQYHFIEYQLINNNKFQNIFIFKQPYTYREINKFSSINLDSFKQNKEMYFDFSPGISSYGGKVSFYPYFDITSLINIDNTILNISIDLDKRLIADNSYHGDKKEFLTGYIKNSYFLSNYKNIQFFGGRLSRNYGILNEYSLIFSNNPYPFDHYGFSLSGDKINYSFYTSRINDFSESLDSEGVVIPVDSVLTTNRFFSFSHLDLKLSEKFQLALSQSIIYGGPDQTFQALFLNPFNFYYVDQRNSRVQMNGFWQILLAYKVSKKSILYLDFLVDDFVINNDAPNERDENPDRLGLILKFSIIPNSSSFLNTFTYTKIYNDTYTTFRNFENYFYELKGIGYPLNSFESIKIATTYFGKELNSLSSELKFSRQGESDLFKVFESNKNIFPIPPVLYSINFSKSINYLILNKISLFYSFSFRLESYHKNLINNKKIVNHNLRLIYKL